MAKINELYQLEQNIIDLLSNNKLRLSTVESCTGGLIVSTLINGVGSSNVISESYVTYSEKAKISVVGVNKSTIDKYSVYSKEVAKEMVYGLYNLTKSNICLSVTGISGSSLVEEGKGSCHFCIYIKNNKIDYLYEEYYENIGTRNVVRINQTNHILTKLLELLKQYF